MATEQAGHAVAATVYTEEESLYYRARGKIETLWRPALSPTEERALSWIVYTTCFWKKNKPLGTGTFSLEQMLGGIPSKKRPGQWEAQPVGLARSTLRQALKRLRDMGVLSATRIGGWRMRYRVNIDWQPTHLGQPQPISQSDQNSAHGGLESDTAQAESQPPYKERNTKDRKHKESNTGQRPDGAGYDGVEGDKPKAVQGNSKSQSGPNSESDLETLWQTAFRETWPNGVAAPPRWTKRDKFLLRAMTKRWAAEAHGAFPTFLEWAVRNWWRIIRTKFGWMTKQGPPSVPQLAFINRFLNEFAEVFCDRQMHEFLATQPQEQACYWELRKHGKSQEEAMLEIATRAALAADRAQREKDLKEAARLHRQAALLHKQAEQLGRWTKANPHPDAVHRVRFNAPMEDHWDKEPPRVNFRPWEEAEPPPGNGVPGVRHRSRATGCKL